MIISHMPGYRGISLTRSLKKCDKYSLCYSQPNSAQISFRLDVIKFLLDMIWKYLAARLPKYSVTCPQQIGNIFFVLNISKDSSQGYSPFKHYICPKVFGYQSACITVDLLPSGFIVQGLHLPCSKSRFLNKFWTVLFPKLHNFLFDSTLLHVFYQNCCFLIRLLVLNISKNPFWLSKILVLVICHK